MHTAQPCRASSAATARPIPRDEPVTSAIFSMMFVLLGAFEESIAKKMKLGKKTVDKLVQTV